MALYAKEEVWKMRKAEFEMQKSSNAMSYPKTRTSTMREDRHRRADNFNFMRLDSGPNQVSFGGRRTPRKDPALTRGNMTTSLSSTALNLNIKSSLKHLYTNKRPSYDLMPGFRTFPSSPYAQPIVPPNYQNPYIPDRQSTKTNNAKGTKSSSTKTQKSVDTMKFRNPKVDQSKESNVVMISKPSKKEQPKGRIFRHRYQFQESVEPSPAVSQTTSALIGLPSGIQVPKTNTNTSTKVLSCKTSKENLCLPSPIQKGPSSWINRKFPRIAHELLTWKEHSKMMKPVKEVMFPGVKVQRPAYNASRPARETSPELLKPQPLPHKRGLVGVEISEFDAGCAVFYRDRNGTYNPHLLPRFGENNTEVKATELKAEISPSNEEVTVLYEKQGEEI